jgi:DNA ligase-1
MRTQPQDIIAKLEADNSRLAKEAVLAEAMEEGLDEFFEGVKMALDKLYTFGVKEVPVRENLNEVGQGLTWENFKVLAESLYKRELTGHAARDAIELAMGVATEEQWNGFYRRILIKDLRCGVSEKTVNKVAKKFPQYKVPVFECCLAHDSANHEKKLEGVKLLEPKLDGVRCLTVIDYEQRTVVQYTRNGKVLENFTHITDALLANIDHFERSYVLDGEVISNSFQDLMKQVHRKDNVETGDAKLMAFDIIPLVEFKAGISTMKQRARSAFLKDFEAIFTDMGCIEIVPQTEVDLDTLVGEIEFKDYNKEMVEAGYEGIMIKDPNAKYECKRTTSWLKMKPFIEVSLEVVDVEEGTGRNQGRLGAIICEGVDDSKHIKVNVGSGFTDDNRSEFWTARESLNGQVVEVRADAITQNQDGTYSLRFPRFLRFRGFKAGEKI